MKTLKEYTDLELKALAYDHLAQIEMSNNVIKAINEELALRKQNPVSESVDKKVVVEAEVVPVSSVEEVISE